MVGHQIEMHQNHLHFIVITVKAITAVRAMMDHFLPSCRANLYHHHLLRPMQHYWHRPYLYFTHLACNNTLAPSTEGCQFTRIRRERTRLVFGHSLSA